MAISLSKNQSVSLTKESGSTVTAVHVGLGWDAVKSKGLFGLFGGGGGDIDLDASCVMLDSTGREVDTVWFRKLESDCGAVVHSGDNRTGAGDGDDEVITINLRRVPSEVQHLAFTVNSFTGQNFTKVENAGVRILDQANKELATYNLAQKGEHTALFIASLSRTGGDWQFKAHGIPANGRTIESMIPMIVRELAG
ncbi:TerD family protein [Nissabacter sp. SGAir0207]|uniref:TerD family protein n=1 Tax=Nissabacter sp. SGAir0207 TaxID=2126321 RepID=UPI0010CD2E9F|nr:TerD family protein [Nissabacter sp. SGAir0207]QCR38533.1 tellurium resistance protein TerZ [Nissabacter sp. SGAir0207]